jgi:hypothetical protein
MPNGCGCNTFHPCSVYDNLSQKKKEQIAHTQENKFILINEVYPSNGALEPNMISKLINNRRFLIHPSYRNNQRKIIKDPVTCMADSLEECNLKVDLIYLFL